MGKGRREKKGSSLIDYVVPQQGSQDQSLFCLMETLVQSLIREESSRFIESIPWRFSYGTAGFRDKAERLDRVLFRVGVLAALRSKVVGGIDLQMNNVCQQSASSFLLQLLLE